MGDRWRAFRELYVVRYWPPIPAVVAAGILSAYYFGITGTYWAVTGEFTRWGGNLLQPAGFHPETWSYYELIGLQGMPWNRLDGGRCAAGHRTACWELQAAAAPQPGGFLYGDPLILPACLDLRGRYRRGYRGRGPAGATPMAAVAGGAAAGQRIPGTAAPRAGAHPSVAGGRSGSCVRCRGFCVLALGGLFGVGFGVLIDRDHICFTSAFLDLWITGRATMAKAIVLGMAASSLGTAAFVHAGVPGPTRGAHRRLPLRRRYCAGRRLRDRVG